MSDTPKHQEWLPLEEAAKTMNRNVSRIRSQIRNCRIQRDRHFRLVGDHEFEINVSEYLRWLEEEKEARKLPLVDRVIRDMKKDEERIAQALDEIAKKRASTPASTLASTPKSKPKLVPISVWAEQTFGEFAPSTRTILRWAKGGYIHPSPKKIGRGYFVSPDAEYLTVSDLRVRRMVRL
ncbi:hypothetical protein WJ63_13715 [Burkholderia pyrrocinia]|nr:hypothetical protein WJ63_13715 [Burkholderia pyrrocinia]